MADGDGCVGLATLLNCASHGTTPDSVVATAAVLNLPAVPIVFLVSVFADNGLGWVAALLAGAGAWPSWYAIIRFLRGGLLFIKPIFGYT